MIKYFLRRPTAKEYNVLRESVGWGAYEHQFVAPSLKKSIYCITVYDGKNIVGMGRIVGDKRLVFIIQDIIVIPEYQKKGIGKLIMNEIMKYVDKYSINNTYVGLMASKGREEFDEKFRFERRPNDRLGAGMVQFIKK